MNLKLPLPIIAIMLAVFSLNSYADDSYGDSGEYEIIKPKTTRKPTTRAPYIDPNSDELNEWYSKRGVLNTENSSVDNLRKRSNNA
uniref:Secreted protein n=1 Tax=Strongyloides venezuelensis TaxID=75913 RepID=A0A0K0F4G3_STRVS